MNSYAVMARDHWAKWRPNQLAEISDPETFFTRLGETVEADIDQLTTDLAGADVPGEGYMGKLGRLRMARFTAESTVLREQVLLPPENPEALEDFEADELDDPMTPPEAPWLPVREPAPSLQIDRTNPA
jgi:hypothetical protein